MEFSQRIETILQGRKLSPWARQMGLSNSFVTRTRENKPPNSMALGLISKVERVSINWLLTGMGVPFIVSTIPRDEDFAEYLDILSDENWDATIMVCYEYPNFAIATLQQPGQLSLGNGSMLDYTIHEVVYGATGGYTAEVLGEKYPGWKQLTIDKKSFELLSEGQMGNLGLEELKGHRKAPAVGEPSHDYQSHPHTQRAIMARIESDFLSVASENKDDAHALVNRLIRILADQ